MYDINFIQNSFLKKISAGELSLNEINTIEEELEILRDKKPKIFAIFTKPKR